MKKFNKIYLILVALPLIILSATAFTNEEKYFDIAKNLDIFATLYKEVNTFYVDDVDPNQLIKTGVDAMLKSLDPYTNYIPEDKIEDYRFMTTGQYGGIGAVIGTRNGETTILNPYEGFPAHKSGLRIGDVIKVIDDVKIKDMNTSEVSKLLKGQAGTKLNIKVQRYGVDTLINIPVTRAKIKVDNVPYYGMISEDIGYIELTGFTRSASREVKAALEALKAQGAKKLVFDLRNNGGGLLQQAIEISNVFVPKGMEIVSTKGKIPEWNRTHKTQEPAMDTDIPIVMLTNGGTASAAEIVSGVMQDYDRGVLVGRTTFGKGLVQTTRKLSYNAQLKVTIAKYYTPSGRCIQALDYSHKKDGKAQKIADSLRTEYKTKNGRSVFDGKGLDPDIEIEPIQYSEITKALRAKSLFFDYATEYRERVDSIPPAKEFSISDKEYIQFIAWLENKEYDYETRSEKKLEELKEIAKEEKLDTIIGKEIAAIELKVKKDKNKDLLTNKEEIREFLETEIARRYYLNAGEIEASFDDDRDIQKAIEVLNNKDLYAGILSGDTVVAESSN